jgi:hypothetical protein
MTFPKMNVNLELSGFLCCSSTDVLETQSFYTQNACDLLVVRWLMLKWLTIILYGFYFLSIPFGVLYKLGVKFDYISYVVLLLVSVAWVFVIYFVDGKEFRIAKFRNYFLYATWGIFGTIALYLVYRLVRVLIYSFQNPSETITWDVGTAVIVFVGYYGLPLWIATVFGFLVGMIVVWLVTSFRKENKSSIS